MTHTHPLRFPAHRCGICQEQRRRTYAAEAVYLNGRKVEVAAGPTVTLADSATDGFEVRVTGCDPATVEAIRVAVVDILDDNDG